MPRRSAQTMKTLWVRFARVNLITSCCILEIPVRLFVILMFYLPFLFWNYLRFCLVLALLHVVSYNMNFCPTVCKSHHSPALREKPRMFSKIVFRISHSEKQLLGKIQLPIHLTVSLYLCPSQVDEKTLIDASLDTWVGSCHWVAQSQTLRATFWFSHLKK